MAVLRWLSQWLEQFFTHKYLVELNAELEGAFCARQLRERRLDVGDQSFGISANRKLS